MNKLTNHLAACTTGPLPIGRKASKAVTIIANSAHSATKIATVEIR